MYSWSEFRTLQRLPSEMVQGMWNCAPTATLGLHIVIPEGAPRLFRTLVRQAWLATRCCYSITQSMAYAMALTDALF
jgi:hypothetical protein